MRKGSKIIVIVGAALVGGGLLLALAGFLLGGAVSLSWDGERLRVLDNGENARRIVEERELEAWNSVVIRSGTADVRFAPADSYGVRLVDYDASEQLSYRIEDGVLYVEGAQEPGISVSLGFLFQARTPEITVYLPEEAVLERVTLEQDAGELEIDGLSAGELEIALSMGDAALSGLSVDSLQLENDTGEVELADSAVKTASVTMDLGDLELEDTVIEGTASLENNCGDITLNNCTIGNLEKLSCDLGDITAENLTADGLNLFCDTGSAALQGRLTGRITAQMNLGDLELEIAGAREEYAVTAETNLGDVTVDGESMPRYETVPDAPNRIEVTSEIGDVTVDFR